MDNLIENSIHIVDGQTTVCWGEHSPQEEVIDVAENRSKFNGYYAVNNSTICFVMGREMYVTPYTRQAIATLIGAGLTQSYFYVPFSNWDYPKYERAKWLRLREQARESYHQDFERDCASYCDAHGIGELDQEILDRCFKMPRGGVSVKHPLFEDTYYPACGDESVVDCTVIDKLGTFCRNNGRVVFVYRDGHTYVARGYWIIDELRRAGYRERGLFVPFSNSEKITDPHLATRWAEICKK